jgi:hypothetical protein
MTSRSGPSDRGLYVKLDAHFADDERIMEAGEAAAWLYVLALAKAKQLSHTDGVLTRGHIERLGLDNLDQRIERLVATGLWLREGAGYRIAAWLKWNKSAQEIAEIRRTKAEAGRRGGIAKARNSQNQNQSHREAATAGPINLPGNLPGNMPGLRRDLEQWRQSLLRSADARDQAEAEEVRRQIAGMPGGAGPKGPVRADGDPAQPHVHTTAKPNG